MAPTPTAHPQVQIEVRGLYAGYNQEAVIQNINLQVFQGDFIGLIGPDGGGKTTLLKSILGLLPPQQGQIEIMGQTPEAGRRHIGYVPQFSAFDADFPIRVKDVVRMGRLSSQRLFQRFNREDDRVAEEKLNRVGLLNLKDRSIRELSGGQRQRVYIARALVSDPAIMLLDEPTISVDFDSRSKIYELLHEFNQGGVTILLVSHDLNVISSYVKTIGCLNRKLHYHGEKEITPAMLQAGYENCPVELIAHGIPHRVLAEHREKQ